MRISSIGKSFGSPVTSIAPAECAAAAIRPSDWANVLPRAANRLGAHLAGELDEADAIAQIAANYRACVDT